MADKNVSVEIALRAQTREYTRALGEAGKATEKFTKTLNAQNVNTFSGSVAGLQKNIVALASSYVGLSKLKDALVGIVGTGAQFEALTGQVSGLLGSLTAGRSAVSWITDFATRTPFELDGVTQAFIKLKAFGIDPMDGTMQALADTTARIGGDQQALEGMILAVGQAWSKQKLQGEEILQLIERGVPVWDLLAEVTGKNVEEIQKLSSEGKLGRDVIADLVTEMGRVNAGAAVSAMDSFNGRLSNLKDTWAAAKNEIAQSGVLEAASDILADLSRRISALIASGDLQAWGAQVAHNMSAVYEAVRAVVLAIPDWTGAIRALAAAWVAAKVVNWIVQIKRFTVASTKAGAIMALVTGGVVGLGKAIAIVAGAVAVDKLVGDFLSLEDASGKAGASTGSLVKDLIQIQDDLHGLGDAGKDAAEKVRLLWLQFKDGKLTAKETTAAAQALFAKVASEASKVAELNKKLVSESAVVFALEKKRAEALADAAKKASISRVQIKIKEANEILRIQESALQSGIDAEKKYNDQVQALSQGLTQSIESQQAHLRELGRSDLTDKEKQAAIEKDIQKELSQAMREYAINHDYVAAQVSATRAMELSEQLNSTKKQKKYYTEAADAFNYAKKQEVAVTEEAAAKQAAANKQTATGIEAQKALIATLAAQLDTLTADTTIIKIDADISAAEAKVQKLLEQIARINTGGVGVTSGNAAGGPIPALAAGGSPRHLTPGMIRGPGTGTSDSILARVSSGEHAFVTKASRAKQLWPLLNALNFGSDRMVQQVLSNLPAGLSTRQTPLAIGGYATGGSVSNSMQPVNIHLPGSTKPSATLFGEREQVQAFEDSLARWSRGYAT